MNVGSFSKPKSIRQA